MKSIVLAFLVMSSFSAFTQTISQSIADIEYQNDAVCIMTNQSFKKCINKACFNRVSFKCDSNDSTFTA